MRCGQSLQKSRLLVQSGLGSEHCIVWLTPALHSPSRGMHAIVFLCTVCKEVALFSGRGSFPRSICEETTSGSGVCDNVGSDLQGQQRIPSHLDLSITPTR